MRVDPDDGLALSMHDSGRTHHEPFEVEPVPSAALVGWLEPVDIAGVLVLVIVTTTTLGVLALVSSVDGAGAVGVISVDVIVVPRSVIEEVESVGTVDVETTPPSVGTCCCATCEQKL